MIISIRNEFHNKTITFRVKSVNDKQYSCDMANGYCIYTHSGGRLANYNIRLSNAQTKRFFTESCGASSCTCHKFDVLGYRYSSVTQQQNGQINVLLIDVPIKYIK